VAVDGAFDWLDIHGWDVTIHEYAVFGCIDKLDRDIHKREYSHEILEQVDTKIYQICSSNLDGVAAADVATIINKYKQPSNNFIY